eukprot:CAMPEP_0203948770 /NCGR_PEP_ID=MMETSP0359-20131031/83351_1 /ASSEMBLY_ACC=CAM_ASM_000338 /TAXON_ID=268821 /ORGANISM="Scrippsiella Hangoei, Strain SHTV-5" /LENGTH=136 /DNA_ID=CAMNT_0050880457 /DNA_START=33 /DNA_END=440 /DNA_ORIENTATION=+
MSARMMGAGAVFEGSEPAVGCVDALGGSMGIQACCTVFKSDQHNDKLEKLMLFYSPTTRRSADGDKSRSTWQKAYVSKESDSKENHTKESVTRNSGMHLMKDGHMRQSHKISTASTESQEPLIKYFWQGDPEEAST